MCHTAEHHGVTFGPESLGSGIGGETTGFGLGVGVGVAGFFEFVDDAGGADALSDPFFSASSCCVTVV